MVKRSLSLLLALASLAATGCGAPGSMSMLGAVRGADGKFLSRSLHAPSNRFSQHELLVKMAPGGASPIAGVTVKDRFNGYEIHALPEGTSLDAAIAAYRQAPGVTSFDRLEMFPLEDDGPATPVTPRGPEPALACNDAQYFQQWSHQVANVPQAWAIERGREDVVVAVLDTGVDYTHPDLAGQVLNGPDFGEFKGDAKDIGSHGTHVAGIIAARADNGIGVAGVAPGCKVLAVKIFYPYYEDGVYKGTYTNALAEARGVQYAATTGGAKVINISAGIGDDPLIDTMLQFARGRGVVVCVSAGNDGSNNYSGEPKYGDGILAVHATDSQDRLASFSNYGNVLGVSAPGVQILSTVPTYANPITGKAAVTGGYDSFNGTSMASPFVAGLSALVVSTLLDKVGPDLQKRSGRAVKAADIPVTVVEDLIRQTAFDLGNRGRDETYGAGRVDAGRALEAASSAEWVARTTSTIARNWRR
jgi:thermitase